MKIDNPGVSCWRSCVLLLIVIAAGCASDPLVRFSLDTPPVVLAPAEFVGVEDGRARFREIFCAITEERGRDLPDYRPCEESLWQFSNEEAPTGMPVSLEVSHGGLRLLTVLGLGWDCLAGVVQPTFSAFDHATAQGYEAGLIPVDGLGSIPNNAEQIRNAILELDGVRSKNLVLLGYSKGAADILEAIVRYPEIRSRVAAVVSLAGLIGGSPLAEDASESQLNLLPRIPGSTCEPSQGDVVNNMRAETRIDWLVRNELPQDVRFFSVVSFADRDNISFVLRSSYDKLAEIDPRNDSHMIHYDQIIPGSELLAYLNADHWAVAVPIERNRGMLVDSVVNHNDFPREVLFEAIARHVEERLAER